MEFRSYREFWPFYVLQHSKRATRLWHAVGTSCVFLLLIAAGFTGKWWLLLLIPVIAYGLAWFSHFFIEGNKPATFGHPLWSLCGDFQMYFLTISGQMGAEVARVQKLYQQKK
ncbi:hypothetical protein EV586_1029 [Tumebacillus sp. BK434]|uniref:DUF962 domain-containing protein n=1 Tax=Tumebacillus sp. BK434 TaxID=2512169 RepID=UPI001049A0BD|nr:DUF962 domain-containing protein [Tumebacillus sp. BK434]TCP57568.1 hypothetical protein EV586_1029 [Tumebacillus sp. BK434]